VKTQTVVRSARVLAVLALVTSAVALVSAPTLGAATHAQAGGDSETRDAVVTLEAGSARLVGNGAERRLVVDDVDPDTAAFQATGAEEAPLSASSAAKLLSTEPSVVAVVRGRPDESQDQEAERLRLSHLAYDWTEGTLKADARTVPSSAVSPELRERAGSADGDGQLPEGPIEIVSLDTDTEVSETGAPLAAASAKSSYEVRLTIEYSGLIGHQITGEVIGKDCVNASGFTINTPDSPQPDARYDAGTFSVETDGECFWKQAYVYYSISVEENGPITLTVTQIGPRLFTTKCTDKWPIASKCQNLPSGIFLHI
jgi:hypothetical protein